jgi:DNA-binding MarR family transcriptional regulator
MGKTLPSASRLVDGLIGRGLMSREEHPVDRRRVRLAITHRGLSIPRTS